MANLLQIAARIRAYTMRDPIHLLYMTHFKTRCESTRATPANKSFSGAGSAGIKQEDETCPSSWVFVMPKISYSGSKQSYLDTSVSPPLFQVAILNRLAHPTLVETLIL